MNKITVESLAGSREAVERENRGCVVELDHELLAFVAGGASDYYVTIPPVTGEPGGK